MIFNSSLQVRFYFKANDGILPRRESRRTLAKTRRDISKPSSSFSSKDVLIPPYVSPGELRILLGVDYKSALSLCNVKLYQQKYFWSDSEGRCFETSNKRKVLVPFELVAPSIKLFGLNPILVDPEPTVPVLGEKGRIPSVAVIGSSDVAYGETISTGLGRSSVCSRFDLSKMTLLGLPDSCSRAMLGRTVSHADLTLVPENFHDREGLEKFFISKSGGKLIEVSENLNLECIKEKLLELRGDENEVFGELVVCEAAVKYRSEAKRTDVLVDAHKPPSASGIILDVLKTAQEGTTALILIKRGVIRLGQNFVAGSGFGKITNIINTKNEALSEAFPGMVVKVGRLVKSDEYTGDFAPDDYLYVLPRERAWRLAFHRQRIEWLNTFQTEGSKLNVVGFELDSGISNPRNFAESRDPPAERIFDNKSSAKHLLKDAERNNSILVEPAEDQDDFYAIQASKQSEKVVTRWQRREEARKEEKRRIETENETERKELHKLRQLVHTGKISNDDDIDKHAQRAPTPLGDPLPSARPVIPLIFKTASASVFDAVLDEIELLEQQFNVKLPVVHGGLGPVSPNDIIHAEIESKFAPCPIYMINTTYLPQSVSGAVELLSFSDADELLSHVRQRITSILRQRGRISNRNALSRRFLSAS